ncbi:MAG TPA: PAS domain S-box protein, partial [Chryseosolibacter sp.]
MILFANHNFIKDPPFSNIDIISCRNVLIYLNRSAQERVLETFHFALRPNGFLFLGSSESADGANDLYTNYSREHHIFQKKQITSARQYPVPESAPNIRMEPLHADNLLMKEGLPQRHDRIPFGDLHHRLLEEYAPPSVVVNPDHDIVHLSERAGRYLLMGGGDPSQNILKLVRQELRLELRSALYQAMQRQMPVEARALTVTVEDRTETVNIHVRPVVNEGDPAKGYILIIFERVADGDKNREILLASDEPIARQLEDELNRLKAQLRTSNEQHEFHAEELKASNEELQAMNEEMRSAAEELETSKEELQSINEELRTVNQELKIKVEETTMASNNLHNLINSVDIGTIFLDRSFRVAFFTPAARELFNLIPSDHGRPLSDITGKLVYDKLIDDAEFVLEKLRSVDREVHSTDGRVFIMRILPYRTAEDRINGVVITFFDVTARKKTEEALQESEQRFRAIVSQTTAGISQMDLDGKLMLVNAKLSSMLGYTANDLVGRSIWDITFDQDIEKKKLLYEQVKLQGTAFDLEIRLVHKNGTILWVNESLSLIRNDKNQPESIVAVIIDITDRKKFQEQKDEFIGIASHELKTPVTSIKAYAQILQERLEKNLKADENPVILRKLNRQVDRLSVLIRDLLDTTRIAEGGLEFHPERFAPDKLIRAVVEEMQPLSDIHKLVFNPGQVGEVVADAERIEQVLTNLVSNAIKYSPDGGNITITSEAVDNGIKISVTDEGIGIPEELQAKVFDRFFRVSNSSVATIQGMGLGLYISSAIVQRHGGKLWVESKPGNGSVFSFTIPY